MRCRGYCANYLHDAGSISLLLSLMIQIVLGISGGFHPGGKEGLSSQDTFSGLII